MKRNYYKNLAIKNLNSFRFFVHNIIIEKINYQHINIPIHLSQRVFFKQKQTGNIHGLVIVCSQWR